MYFYISAAVVYLVALWKWPWLLNSVFGPIKHCSTPWQMACYLLAVVFILVSPPHMAYMLHRDITNPGDDFFSDPRRYGPLTCVLAVIIALLAWKAYRIMCQTWRMHMRGFILDQARIAREAGDEAGHRYLISVQYPKYEDK